jgi:large subunit ribosomal protein L15
MRFKKKKVHKKRASTFHGWGKGASHHKGAGNRGGRGRAGSGKKSDGKKPSFWKEPQGRRGFNPKSRMIINQINILQVEEMMRQFESKGIAVPIQGSTGYEVDLSKSTYNKLLASGTPSQTLNVKVDFASKGVGKKLQASGGSLTILKVIVRKEKKKTSAKKKKADEGDAANDKA